MGMKAYLWLMACAAIGVQVYWLATWRGPGPTGVGLPVLLVGLAVLAQHFPVALAPKRKVDVSVSAYFASLLLLGAPFAVALVGVSHLVGQLTLTLRRNPATGKRLRTVRSALFNTSQAMVATALGAAAYYAALPHSAPAPLERIENAWALPAAALVMYMANTLAVAIVVGIQLEKPPLRVWTGARTSTLLEFAGLFLVGAGIARAGAHDPMMVLVMALPAGIVYWSLARTARLEQGAGREPESAAPRELERLKAELMSLRPLAALRQADAR